MSSTNKTSNYELSQFLATDVPSWLVDYNGDMSKIDTQMKVNATAAATAQSKADGADGKADVNADNIVALNNQLNTPNTGIAARVSDLEGDVDGIQELLGNGTPTTTDHTVIGAINEINAKVGSGTLDTTAQDIIGAINEVNATAASVADELNGALNDTYIMMYQMRHSFAITGDTLGEALNNLANHILDFIQGMPDDARVEVLNIRISGPGIEFTPFSNVLYDNTATDFSLNMIGGVTSGSNISAFDHMIIWATQASVNYIDRCELHDNQYPTTVRMALADIPTASSFTFDMRHWKHIGNGT